MTNKYRTKAVLSIFTLICLLIFPGCSETTCNWNPITYKLDFAFINAEGETMNPDWEKESLLVYFYNSNYELLHQEEFDLQSTNQTLLTTDKEFKTTEELIVYAVTVNKESNLIYPVWSHSLEDFTISYPSTDGYKPIRPIFSALIMLRKGWNPNKSIKIPLTRKVGKVQVTLNHPEHSIEDPAIYDAEIKQISAQINIHDQGSDSRLCATVPFSFKSAKSLTTEKITMFPSETNKGLVIEIRKNGKVFMTVEKDNNNNLFECRNDQLLNIEIDLNTLSTSVTVKPWENIHTDIEI